jgi:hypothetical protein
MPATPTLRGDASAPAALDFLNQAEAPKGEAKGHITQMDIDALAQEVTQRCIAAGVPYAEITKLVAKLNSNLGASKDSLNEIRGEALRDADSLVSETSVIDETEAARTKRLEAQFWADMHVLNAKAKAEFDALGGYTSKEEKDTREALEREIAAAQKSGDKDAKLAAQGKLAAFYQKTGHEVHDRAVDANDDEVAKHADRLEKYGEEVEKKAKEISNAEHDKLGPKQSGDRLELDSLDQQVAVAASGLANVTHSTTGTPAMGSVPKIAQTGLSFG